MVVMKTFYGVCGGRLSTGTTFVFVVAPPDSVASLLVSFTCFLTLSISFQQLVNPRGREI